MLDEVASPVDVTNISRNWSPSDRPEGVSDQDGRNRVFLRRRPAGQGQEGGNRNHQAGRGPEERRAKARERPRMPGAGRCGPVRSKAARSGRGGLRRRASPVRAQPGHGAPRPAGTRTGTCGRRRRGGGKVGVASEEVRP